MRGVSLVVGIDGTLGKSVFAEASRRGAACIGTTRRAELLSRGSARFLDLSQQAPAWIFRERFFCAYLCAGVTAFSENEGDPSYAGLVNLTRTVELTEALVSRGAFLVFPSTSGVFPGDRADVTEAATTSPVTTYGKLKAEAERELLRVARCHAYPAGVAIVRITKVVTAMKEPFRGWLANLRNGRVIHPYSDLNFAPVSLKYAVNGLLESGWLRQSGVFHLSGSSSVTYAEFAILVASALGASSSLVVPVRMPTGSGTPMFRPVHAALGMEETGRRLGLAPQKPEEAAAHLVEEYLGG